MLLALGVYNILADQSRIYSIGGPKHIYYFFSIDAIELKFESPILSESRRNSNKHIYLLIKKYCGKLLSFIFLRHPLFSVINTITLRLGDVVRTRGLFDLGPSARAQSTQLKNGAYS